MPQHRFQRAALGGTFDHIHRGHRQLLAKAFDAAGDVVIGLTTDRLVRKEGKKGIKPYSSRKRELEEYLKQNFPRRTYSVRPLSQPLGEIGSRRDIDVIVVSEETFQRAVDANFVRLQKNLIPLAVYVIPMEKAEDMQRISSTRIRAGEIDEEGKLRKTKTISRRVKKRGSSGSQKKSE